MSGTIFIFADLMELAGRDAWHAACTEKLALLFLVTPLVIGAPYLLARWDKFKRADNARIREHKRKKLERMVQR